MDVVRLVVEDHQLVDVADDGAQIYLGVGSGTCRTFAKEEVHRFFVVGRRRDVLARIDAVDVSEEDVAGALSDPHLVLKVKGQLKIVMPVSTIETVVRDNRVLEEEFEALEILVDAVEHDDVRRDYKEVARQVAAWLIHLVEVTPSQRQAQHLGLARAGRHLHDIAPPCLIEHAGRDRARTVEAH
ncbi:MAG: hypothetical protein DDT34_02525 [Firmicutes bacterium]|nr:hypothetical protein [Bacillota bacterium]